MRAVLGVGILSLSKEIYADILLSQVNILFLVLIINAPAFSKVDNKAKPVSSSNTPALVKQIVFDSSNST